MWRPSVVLPATVLALVATFAARAGAQRVPPDWGTSPSMQVIEFGTPSDDAAPVHWFTVVGAVERSAAFQSRRTCVPLQSLIAACRGPTEHASDMICILRDGRPRLQMTVAAAANELVFSGEIVVIPASGAGHPRQRSRSLPATTPVACIGLVDRPVVLPLDNRIQSPELLLAQLLQPRSLLKHVRLVYPPGQAGEGRLVAGTVIYFDPVEVNRQTLSAALSAEPFPPGLNLDEPTASQRLDGPRERIEVPAPLFAADAPDRSASAGPAPVGIGNPSGGTIPAPAIDSAAPLPLTAEGANRASFHPSIEAGTASPDPAERRVDSLSPRDTQESTSSWAFTDLPPSPQQEAEAAEMALPASSDEPPPPTADAGAAAVRDRKTTGISASEPVLLIGAAAACCLVAGIGWSRRLMVVHALRTLARGLSAKHGPVRRLTGRGHGAQSESPQVPGAAAHERRDDPHPTVGRAQHLAIDEQRLRTRIREVLGSRPAQSYDRSSPAAEQPSAPAMMDEVVQVDERTSAAGSSGALERALRLHARRARR